MLSSIKELRLLSQEGGRVILEIRIGFSWEKWVLEFKTTPERLSGKFIQIHGPFRNWSYTFKIHASDERTSTLEEEVEYALPFPLSASRFYKKVERYFRWRQKTLEDDLMAYARAPLPPLKILITGSTGLVGAALVPFLKVAGHEVVRLVRSKEKAGPSAIFWNPQSGEIDLERLEGFDLVIHLAGENIAAHRWSKEQKERLFVSRCRDTWLLSQALIRLSAPPKTVICASACGIYGNRGTEKLNEKSLPGQGFLAELCVKWEAATSALERQGIRVLNTRFGYGLSSRAGVLAKMLPAFRLGLGGKIGNGEQIMPWIAVDDMVGAIYHLIADQKMHGPVNVCGPNPISQGEFSKTLAHAVHRPAFFHLPARLLRLFLGEMADELLLTSENAYPEKLLESGYTFRYESLGEALRTLII